MAGIFKAYDIRGAYPSELNEEIARRIGRSFVDLLKADRIVVGKDMRLSASSLAGAFIDGAMSAGADVADVGMTSTPQLYFAIIEGKFDGGVMVTASHLPGGINGFKLCREKAIPLSGDRGLPELKRLVNEGAAGVGSGKGLYRTADFLDAYIERLARSVHDPKPLKIVVDAGNGMAGPEVFRLFERVPVWNLIPMYMDPDGSFPHHIANPLLVSATKDLQLRVVSEKADLGVAFDGDADRCGFIDEKGERIPEDLVTGLIAEFFLSKHPGAGIVYDLRSSRAVPEAIAAHDGKALRSRVGHSFIKEIMRETGAVFGGELSGHYYYRDMGITDNALFTMIQVLNDLSTNEMPISVALGPLRKYSSTGEINLQVGDSRAIYAALETKYGDARMDHLDGLTVQFDAWWFNLRASNTEPLMRLNLEADEAALRDEKKEEVLGIIRQADPSAAVQN